MEDAAGKEFFLRKFSIKQLQNNIKLLRNVYGMTYSDVCFLEDYFKKTTLHSWENAIRIPTCDSLLVYAATFGASIDWLYGISRVPYTLQSIDYAEEVYYKNIGHAWDTDTISTNLFDDSISEIKFVRNSIENYCNHMIRKKEYSPEARANVLVLHKFSSSIAMHFQFKLALDNNRCNPDLFTKNEKKKYKQIVESMIDVINTTYPVYTISANVSGSLEQ